MGLGSEGGREREGGRDGGREAHRWSPKLIREAPQPQTAIHWMESIGLIEARFLVDGSTILDGQMCGIQNITVPSFSGTWVAQKVGSPSEQPALRGG